VLVEIDDREAFEISLIENIQRRTINPIEEAHAFSSYITDFGWEVFRNLQQGLARVQVTLIGDYDF
jgi:ParB family transcriptional regulator, chromosome partitioning protein